MKNKTAQNMGTMSDLEAIQTEIDNLTEKGIQVPDAVKLLNDPQLILVELNRIRDESGDVVDATEGVEDAAISAVEIQERSMQEMQDISDNIAASVKPFNFKKAQAEFPVDEIVTPEDTPFEVEETNDNILASMQLSSVEDLVAYLDRDDIDEQRARDEIMEFFPSEDTPEGRLVVEALDRQLQQYFETVDWNTVDDPVTKKIQMVLPIWKNLSSEPKSLEAKPGVIENAKLEKTDIVSFVNDIDNSIKKLAQDSVKEDKKPFNLKKEAQAKTIENVVMYGPNEKRYDPFLRQPVTDWNIVERNKGFGLVVDDVWNIDWESIWRGTIMDKYSRPYRDTKTGEWVGGYIQKRFEVDKNIPAQNNLQLLPGERRKPYIPEHKGYEARLEAMREKEASERGYEPASEGKPFNWKEAQSKKKIQKIADLPAKDRALPGQDFFNPKLTAPIQMCADGSEPNKETGLCNDGSRPIANLGVREQLPGEPEKARNWRARNKTPEFIQVAEEDTELKVSAGKKKKPKAKKPEKTYKSEEIMQLTEPDTEELVSDPYYRKPVDSDKQKQVKNTMDDLSFDG